MTVPLRRILLVDDDKVTNLMHTRQIVKYELAQSIDVVTDGRAALDYLTGREVAGETQPELVLLDINMPRMNGFEFLVEYAKLPGGVHQSQTIVMVSTSTLRRDRERAEADVLVTAYELKPLTSNDFRRIVHNCQSASGSAA